MNLLGASYAWIAIIAVVIILVFLIIVMFISYYNKFVKARNNVEESFSAMDVYLVKRSSLIPNIVNTVKGYAKHEKETLTAVIEARNLANNSTTREERMKRFDFPCAVMQEREDLADSIYYMLRNYPKE